MAPPAFSKTLTFVNNLARPGLPRIRLFCACSRVLVHPTFGYGLPATLSATFTGKVVRLLAVHFVSTFGEKYASNWNQRSASASDYVQNRTFNRSVSGAEASKANCINRSYGAGDGNRNKYNRPKQGVTARFSLQLESNGVKIDAAACNLGDHAIFFCI